MLPTCYFFVVALDDPPHLPVTLALSESIKEIDPKVVHKVGEAAELFVATSCLAVEG